MDKESNQIAVHRLTALWALSESGLGGFFHAFKMPLTGLIVGGIAMILISLICHFAANKWSTLMSSLLLVLIIKFSVSPHSSMTSYFAVSFQAVTAGILFSIIRPFGVACFLLFIIGQMESAFQKLLMLTLFFGNSLWASIDSFGDWVTSQLPLLQGSFNSYNVIYFYCGVHVLAGILLALFTIMIRRQMIKDIDTFQALGFWEEPIKDHFIDRKRKRKRKMILLGGLMIFVLVMSYYIHNNSDNAVLNALTIFTRTVVVLLVWFFIVAPGLRRVIAHYLSKKKIQYLSEVHEVLDLFPYLSMIITKAKVQSTKHNFPKRIYKFFYYLIMHSLLFKIHDKP